MAKSKYLEDNPHLYLKKHQEQFINDYWLNLGDTSKIETANTIGEHPLFEENPALALVDIFRKPENFAYTCKMLLNIELHPLQAAVLSILWKHPFSVFIATRGGSKSFLLAVYAILRALLVPNSQVLFIGNAFRQSKVIFTYCETIYRNAPILQNLLSLTPHSGIIRNTDMYVFSIEQSMIKAIPLGDGEKIRGLRATCTITDERNTLNEEIYQKVIQGFGIVALNPIEQVKLKARYKALLKLGKMSDEEYSEFRKNRISNQEISSGTCGYIFEPLYKIWKQYHDIVMSRGDEDKLNQIFNNEIPPGFSHADYAVLRLPYELYPDDYIDEKMLGRAKATSHLAIYNSEFRTIFINDSDGFFKRSLIEQATAYNQKPYLAKPSYGILEFIASLRGRKGIKYVMAIDPAAEHDNFSIVILGVYSNHRRIEYVWTANKIKHGLKLKHGLTKQHDYYSFCTEKIRDLLKVFDCEFIAIDAQGGGGAIIEKLGDPNHLREGEHPIHPIEEEGVDKPTDRLAGLKMIHVIQFSKADWVATANHDLKHDFETAELVFPMKDSLAFGMAREEDNIYQRRKIDIKDDNLEECYDTLENCMLEIEELKDELVLIEHRRTPSGRDQWGTPEVKGVGTGKKKGHLRKDRYSALLMANAVGRAYINRLADPEGIDYGGRISDFDRRGDGSNNFNIGIAIQKGRRGKF
jgi:hypothetical protein